MRTRAAAAAAFLLLTGAPVRADDYVSIGGGRATPLGALDFNQVAAPGYAGGLEYFHTFYRRFGLGLQADYFAFKTKSVDVLQPKGTSLSTVRVASVDAVIRFAPFYPKGIGPYVLAGAGVNRFSLAAKTTPNPGYAWIDTGTTETRAFNLSSLGPAYVAGAGFEATVSSSGLTFGAEARWHVFKVDRAKFGANQARAFTLEGRIGLRLWD